MNKNKIKTALLAAIAALVLSNVSVVAVRDWSKDRCGNPWGPNSYQCYDGGNNYNTNDWYYDCYGHAWGPNSYTCFYDHGYKGDDNEANAEGMVVTATTTEDKPSSSSSNLIGISSIAGTAALVAASMIY